MFSTIECITTFSAFDSNEISILQESEREANLKWKIHSIQLNIAIMIDCTALLSRIVQSRKRVRVWKARVSNRASKTCHLDTTKNSQHTTNDFNHLILFTFLATSVNRFKLSTIHSNNHRSKTSKNLKKSAQLIEVSIQNEFSLFYIQAIEKQFESNDFDRFVFFAKHQKSKTFYRQFASM